MKFTVYSNELKAVQFFASKDRPRYILTGVNIEAKSEMAPIISATDGRKIITLKSQAAQEPCKLGHAEEQCNVILSSECLAIIQKLFHGKLPILIEPKEKGCVTISMPTKSLEVTCSNGLIQGDFPKFRMVIPHKSTKRAPLSSIAVNPCLLSQLDATAKALKIKDPGLHFQFIDYNAVIVIKFDTCPYVWAGVMPLRLDPAIELWEPDFLDLPAELNAPSPITP